MSWSILFAWSLSPLVLVNRRRGFKFRVNRREKLRGNKLQHAFKRQAANTVWAYHSHATSSQTEWKQSTCEAPGSDGTCLCICVPPGKVDLQSVRGTTEPVLYWEMQVVPQQWTEDNLFNWSPPTPSPGLGYWLLQGSASISLGLVAVCWEGATAKRQGGKCGWGGTFTQGTLWESPAGRGVGLLFS